MKTPSRLTYHYLAAALLALALLAAACSPATPAVVATRPPATVAPTRSVPTLAPTVAPTKAAPTTAPTKAAATAAPTKAATTAPTTAPTTAATMAALPTAEPLGTERVIAGLSIKPVSVNQMTASGTNKPKAGDVYALVTLELQNSNKTGTVKFDPATLLLLNPTAGTSFQMISLPSIATELKATDLKPGEKISGVIAYEVPASITSWELEFKGATNNDNVIWSLAR